ncbi:protein of unknown function [Tenacibaculum aestuariivivum]
MYSYLYNEKIYLYISVIILSILLVKIIQVIIMYGVRLSNNRYLTCKVIIFAFLSFN